MHDILRNFDPEVRSVKARTFLLIVVGYLIAFFTLSSDGEVNEQQILSLDPILLLGIQGVVSIFFFIGFSILFARIALKLDVKDFFPAIDLRMVGLTLLVTFSFFVINSAVGEWNLSLDFPDSAFEEWAKEKEQQLKVLTVHIANFTSTTHFLLAIVVIAIVPAIGEELLFRGLLQNLLGRVISNHHVAIWLTGFIFAAVHLQFYGLFPRMLLGVLFGYLYHWSGKLSVAMLAHFINNGAALLIYFLYQREIIEMAPEQMEESAPWPVVLVFAGVGFVALKAFYNRYSLRNG